MFSFNQSCQVLQWKELSYASVKKPVIFRGFFNCLKVSGAVHTSPFPVSLIFEVMLLSSRFVIIHLSIRPS